MRRLEEQWFQIALKTYFWFGVVAALLCSTSVACMLATKYYYDMGQLRQEELKREYRSYIDDLHEAKENARMAGRILYEVERLKKEIDEHE
jgi:hypothetical protein